MSENICEECGKPFETPDEEAMLCPECWEKQFDFGAEGKEATDN